MRHDSIEKTLRVVITSGLVNRRNFLEALEQRLAPPLQQVGGARCLRGPACTVRACAVVPPHPMPGSTSAAHAVLLTPVPSC
jgi:hypothetical protein